MNERFPGNPYAPRRRITREVLVGDVGVGGKNPIRVQSMTTTDTQDVAATADQVERLADAGCEIVRITAPSIRDAEALAAVRAELDRRRVRIPLVADIHFTPNAAMLAAEAVEKVRINPGNFADKKKFEVREYTDAQYCEELDRVAERFRPLVRRCRELGRALRIGTNHGSLSDRVLNRYGDTPEGMVQSALEFLDVCESEGFFDVIFSMKASNPQVAIQAYRLLALRLAERTPGAPSYPLHVGVTEAGDGEDGRIKSAVGIGSLLLDGLGDTIRVSLTEDPAREVPVAQALARRAEREWARWSGERDGALPDFPPVNHDFVPNPLEHQRRVSIPLRSGPVALGGDEAVRVELDLGAAPENPERMAWLLGDAASAHPDLLCEGVRIAVREVADVERAHVFAQALAPQPFAAPLVVELALERVPELTGFGDRWVLAVGGGTRPEALATAVAAAKVSRTPIEWTLEDDGAGIAKALEVAIAASPTGEAQTLFSVRSPRPVAAQRWLASALAERGIAPPILLRCDLAGAPLASEDTLLRAATDLGALLCDGIGDAIALPTGRGDEDGVDPGRTLELAYRILQGARLRTSWTEFISCPSCGRTLFDLEETTARIKAKTGHLKGVKIAIMGCIVNGPGEMADADFGYVGSGPGVVNLYVGQDCVERRVPSGEAEGRLVDLIRRRGRWVDPV